MKKTVSLIVATVMLVMCMSPAFAADGAAEKLRFDGDGNFKILHLTDWHTAYPMPAVQKQFAVEAIDEAKPDLIVLGGDMSEAAKEDYPAAVKEICDLMVDAQVPFAITFGNHDYLHDIAIDDLFALYKEYGGVYCLSEDDDPALFGCGTCSIPVWSNDDSRVAYNIYCFDSGCEVITDYASQTNDPSLLPEARTEDALVSNYDAVHPDQIAWYQAKAEALKEENGGEFVPSVVFQHIIVQEIFGQFWREAKETDRKGLVQFDEKTYRMTAIPKLSCIKDGYVMERPCPGYYNYGELEAMKKNGDVKAILCGHDHSNSFTVEIDGIDIVNTPSVKPHSTFKKINWGGRIVTLHEDGAYESRVLTGFELAQKKGSGIIASGGISRFELVLTKIWKAFADVSLRLWKFVK